MAWHSTSRQQRGYGAAWDRLRKEILRRDNGICQACLRAGRVQIGREVHHLKPRAAGGSHDPANLETLCGDCHLKADAEALGRTYRPRLIIGADGYPIG